MSSFVDELLYLHSGDCTSAARSHLLSACPADLLEVIAALRDDSRREEFNSLSPRIDLFLLADQSKNIGLFIEILNHISSTTDLSNFRSQIIPLLRFRLNGDVRVLEVIDCVLNLPETPQELLSELLSFAVEREDGELFSRVTVKGGERSSLSAELIEQHAAF